MPEVWPPPPTNQPQGASPPPPAFRPRNGLTPGLDALITSGVAALCSVLSIPFVFSHSPAGGQGPLLDEVSVIFVVSALFFGGTSVIYGLLSRKTRLGRIALGVDLGIIVLFSIIGFLRA